MSQRWKNFAKQLRRKHVCLERRKKGRTKSKQNRRKEKKGNDARKKKEMKGKMEGKKKERRKNGGWKEDKKKDKTKIENIKKVERIKEGMNKGTSMLGLCSFDLQFCDQCNLLRVIPVQ